MNTPVSFPLEKEFVPYTESLELKEIGFDEPCFGWYSDKNIRIAGTDGCVVRHPIKNSFFTEDDEFVSAPTFSQAFRWFREKHDLVHHINRDGGWWLCSILDLYDEEEQGAIETHIDNCYPDTYEEAELACLKKLIELVKNK